MKDYYLSGICNGGLCFTLTLFAPSSYQSMSFFPELFNQKPDVSSLFWWPRWERQPRINALSAAIFECHNQII